jgi:ComF family protein
MPPATVVTHVPTATSRVRRRGYDQAELLARQLAQDLKLPYASLLIRDGQSRQVGATRQARLAQLTHAFRIPKHFPQNVSILLVDDVVTTGATIETAARILRAAGAKSVSAAVFAQKE